MYQFNNTTLLNIFRHTEHTITLFQGRFQRDAEHKQHIQPSTSEHARQVHQLKTKRSLMRTYHPEVKAGSH